MTSAIKTDSMMLGLFQKFAVIYLVKKLFVCMSAQVSLLFSQNFPIRPYQEPVKSNQHTAYLSDILFNITA